MTASLPGRGSMGRIMAVALECPSCTCRFRVEESFRGTQVSCPKCRSEMMAEGQSARDYDVFVSYSHQDKTVAQAVCESLENNRIRCWIAPRDVEPGQVWGDAIIRGIEASCVMVVVFSEQSNASDQVYREIERAAAKKLVIIPLRIDGATMTRRMEFFLSASQWLDAQDGPLETHLDTLVNRIRPVLEGCGQPESFDFAVPVRPGNPAAADQVTDQQPGSPEESGPVVTLTAERGPMAGREFRFEEHDTFIFGRGSSCHASLPDDSFVSRHHFILEVNPPQVCVRDLGSLNGTRVNKVRYGGSSVEPGPEKHVRPAHETATLKSGDRIQVGETVFVVSVEGSDLRVFCQKCGNETELPVADYSGAECLCRACRETVAAASAAPIDSETDAASGAKDADWPPIEGYSPVRKLGSGGMGSVYSATRNDDGQQVAVKVMLSRTVIEERRQRWFLREMDVLGELSHPNIVSFVERGVIGSTFFFVMEFCEGGDVGNLVKTCGGCLRMKPAASILMHALKGLAHAHNKGVVHRDVKPQNLLLFGPRDRWRVKVSDFGLAKNFEKAGFSGMTATGMMGGTCAFMPREQVTDFRYVLPASDVWSTAATFYFMLTGCPPREDLPGQTPLSVILNGKVVPIEQRLPEIPLPLAAVLGKALADDPAQRFQTAGEFRVAVKETLPRK